MDDVKLNEIDDVRSELVKLALSGHYPAIRYYLENAGGLYRIWGIGNPYFSSNAKADCVTLKNVFYCLLQASPHKRPPSLVTSLTQVFVHCNRKSSVKDRLNAKQAKKIGKQQREYIPYDWALIFKANGRNMTKTAKETERYKDVWGAEGISGRVKFLLLAWAGMTKTSFRKNSDSLEACLQ
jgi:hypothetical protein